MDEGEDDSDELRIDDPTLLFQLFQSDMIAAEVDWEDERFVFYPVNTFPEESES